MVGRLASAELLRWALWGVALALMPRSTWAQGDVRGVLFDSLLTNAPVANALVAIEGTDLRARTDRRGRFEFAAVPAGRRTLSYQAPWLDSLSLPPLRTTIVVRDRRTTRARLATPSVAAYHRAVCGATFDEGQGVLRGEIRDPDGAPQVGVFVGAVWSEAILTVSGLGGQLVGSIDTTDAAGFFSLCGVPRESDFFVRAGTDTVGTSDLYLSLGGRAAARRDLIIGDRRRTARLIGRVTNRRGRPIPSVIIDTPGDTALGERADSSGQFVIDGMPLRTTQLFVRAIGFTPRLLVVDVGTAEIELPDIVLDPLPMELAEMRVVAEARTLAELGFRERQRSGSGIFIDDEQLMRFPIISANTLMSMGNGVRSTGGTWPRTMLRRGIQPCFPRFFLDGVDFGVPRDGMEEADLLRRAKRIEIHQAAFMPARFTDFNGCGVVLIWTE